MLSRYRRALLILAALGTLASPAWGQQPAPPNPDLARFLQSLSSESAFAVQVSEIPEAYCQASCGAGATPVEVTCGSCIAVDRDCSVGERGYVQCSGQARQYCDQPPCPPCSVWTNCLTWGAVQCQGWTCNTYPGCGVQCDNWTYSCPLAEQGPDPCW